MNFLHGIGNYRLRGAGDIGIVVINAINGEAILPGAQAADRASVAQHSSGLRGGVGQEDRKIQDRKIGASGRGNVQDRDALKRAAQLRAFGLQHIRAGGNLHLRGDRRQRPGRP